MYNVQKDVQETALRHDTYERTSQYSTQLSFLLDTVILNLKANASSCKMVYHYKEQEIRTSLKQ